MNIYLAGKFTGDGHKYEDWRTAIVPHLGSYGLDHKENQALDATWVAASASGRYTIFGTHTFTGPFWMYFGGHGIGYRRTQHAAGAWANSDIETTSDTDYKEPWNGSTRRDVMKACTRAIDRSDLVFAWLDDPTAYGTLAEIGYAVGLRNAGRHIITVVACPPGRGPNSETWFAQHMADYCLMDCPSPDKGLMQFLAYYESKPRATASRPAPAPVPPAPPARAPVPKMLRWYIIEKFDYTCQYCKRRHHSSSIGPDNKPWHIDHIDPFSRGGDDGPENFTLACARCNLRKHARRPGDFVP